MKVLPKIIQERTHVQPGLFDSPADLKLAEVDASIQETKGLIKELIAENSSEHRSRGRFDIEKSVVDAYKALSSSYKLRHKITGDKADEQKQNHYREIHDNLKWILFRSRGWTLHSAREIRSNILEATREVNNETTSTARSMAQGWRNLLVASVLAAKGVSETEFPIPQEQSQ